MKKLMKVPLFVAAFLLSFNSAAEPTIKQARELTQGNSDQLMFYLGAFVTGLSWANVFSEADGNFALYCPPRKLALTGENVYGITDRYLKRNPSRFTEDDYLTYAAIIALQDAFPCA